ncbi:hypothetical protein SUBVAR_05614 [Subdoligranulum variabile DSM 15176]|uniref:Uncharacterized protein n=1 Tax=Subdoligranulum variabile DSM 15176 TaxID=411471 RepID=D1PMQ1_9FIRM|nr:hypothetical protein SUBVAR_05614 [Subdoligranulum variabile DSM 15176]
MERVENYPLSTTNRVKSSTFPHYDTFSLPSQETKSKPAAPKKFAASGIFTDV